MERLQKIIARAGVASRRASELLITEGRVRVNGRVITELGASADPRKDRVEVDGKRLVAEDLIYAVLHKPRNVVSTGADPEGRPPVKEHLRPLGSRLFPVGRLDFATSGVLLATNDGEFANALLHPKGSVPKTYVVKVRGVMEPADLKRWSEGVDLEDGRTLEAKVSLIRREPDRTWFEITLREGRNQQIRRMGEATGFLVMRLARISFAGVTHEGLRPGQARVLTWQELAGLKESFGVPKRIPKSIRASDPTPTKTPSARERFVAERRRSGPARETAERREAPAATPARDTRESRGRPSGPPRGATKRPSRRK